MYNANTKTAIKATLYNAITQEVFELTFLNDNLFNKYRDENYHISVIDSEEA